MTDTISVQRRTIRRSTRLKGRGLHGGEPVELILNPANDGIHFSCDGLRIEASPENVEDTRRSTTLGPVRTIEHLMSALSGLGITDIDVILDATEVPAMDGSAGPFYRAIREAGLLEVGRRDVSFPGVPVIWQEGGISIAISKGRGRWVYIYESIELWPHECEYKVARVGSEYEARVGRARTFLREADLASLHKQGLARGIDRSTALVVGPTGYMTQPRMEDELVAHKLLDLIGDMYLLGVPARYLDVTAKRSGHRSNVEAARAVIEASRKGLSRN